MYRLVRNYLTLFAAVSLAFLFYAGGYYDYVRETSFDKFTYPLEENISRYVKQMKNGQTPAANFINEYNYEYIIDPVDKCAKNVNLYLVYVVKSSVDHFGRREAIRQSWGDETRFSEKQIRRFFAVGVRRDLELQKKIYSEAEKYGDLIQTDFLDTYYNNTIKTMTSFKWLVKNCGNSKFYMFLDDDYYVSMKNVLRYLENPRMYPNSFNDTAKKTGIIDIKRHYSGYCVPSRPIRDIFSKYRLSLSEYPFDKFPLYSIAGAYVLSADSLKDLFYASYFTKHFKFDDVYLGILSRKIGIIPYHTEYIVREWNSDDQNFQKQCIASHGFEDSAGMVDLWTRQKNLGYA